MKEISRSQGYHGNVRDFICDENDAVVVTEGSDATGVVDGSTCFNATEKVEYIAYKGVWTLYVTLG